MTFLLLILHGVCGFAQQTDTILPVSVYNVEQGLDQSTVYQVLQDRRGLIWVASGGGLQCFDGNTFRSFDPPEELITTQSGTKIIAMVENHEGGLILSSGTSLFHFDSRTGKFSRIESDVHQYIYLFKAVLFGKPLCYTSTGRLYLAGDRRLYRLPMVFGPGEVLPADFNPLEAVITAPGTLCISSATGSLVVTFRSTATDTLLRASWKPRQDIIRSKGKIQEDPMREFRFVNRNGNQSDTFRSFVKDILRDRSGNLWFGTDGNGLLFHPAGQVSFDLAQIGFTRCLAWFDNRVWAGTFNKGLYSMDADLRSVVRVNPEVFSDRVYILDLLPDSAGRLWVATRQGLYVVDHEGKVLFHEALITSSAGFLTAPGYGILFSAYDSLFRCITGKRCGLECIREQTHVREILLFGDAWWIANQYGLFRRKASDGILEALLFKEDQHLTRVPVYSVLPVNGILWAGTERGIALYSRKGEVMALPGYLKSLAHEIIYSLTEDQQQTIWFAGNNGIGCIPAARDRIIRFSGGNNIQSLEFNSNAVLRSPSGRIYFGGIKGLNGIHAPDLLKKRISPSVSLYSLNLSDTAFTGGIPPDRMSVGLRWQDAHFSGTVFSPEYFPAGNVRFSFCLEGFEKNWTPPSSDIRFSYRNLPPGTYRLWGRCTDPFSNEGKAVLLLTLVISPPFWKSPWFIILSAILSIGLIIFVVRKIQEVKYSNLLMEMEHRNAIDRERLRISQDMHDEVGSSLTQIAILSEVMKKRDQDPDERRRIISKISGISDIVVDEMNDIIWALNPKNDNLPSFITYLRQNASEYLSSTGIEPEFSLPGDYPPVPMSSEQRRNLYLVVKEAIHNIVKHSDATSAGVHVFWSDSCLGISITDNGKGFDVGALSNAGNGMTTMRRRVESLNGKFGIISGPGEGTRVSISVMLGAAAPEK